ncbi:MAG TPA: glycosyltransferase, partial [Thermoplasmatales archaeon]|nr:glycosyltransferase [Thermoplasmatales archaeon]
VIVGRGWENTIKNYKAKNKITYLGGGLPYSRIPETYSKCSIFVQPYLYPVPIGRVLIEALQSGLAVITTGNEYYSPIIRNMKDGILIYPMNEKELLEKMQLLIEDGKLRKEIAKNGKKRIYEICSPEKIAGKYIKAYESLEEKE